MGRILRERLLSVAFMVLLTIPWRPANATDVKIASFASFVLLLVWVAKESGYFEREGINAEILFFTGGTEMTSAMLSQSVNFASTMADRPMVLLDRGQQTRILTALTTVAPYSLVVPVNSKIKRGDLAALKGKKIAITQKGSPTDVAMQAILRPERRISAGRAESNTECMLFCSAVLSTIDQILKSQRLCRAFLMSSAAI